MTLRTGLPGLRFHDLRHTIIDAAAEVGVPGRVVEAISDPMSRRMSEHYSRLKAKREALEEPAARPAKTAESESPAKAAGQKVWSGLRHNPIHDRQFLPARNPAKLLKIKNAERCPSG